MNRIDAFLELAVNQGGSDLHMVSGQAPRIRMSGELQPVRFRELSEQDVRDFLTEFMTPDQRQVLAERSAVDFAYESGTAGRFRVNVYQHVGGIGAALRVVPNKTPSLESIGLPAVVQQTLAIGKGLVLVTGPTGSGKSTTLAAMIDEVNRRRTDHILTIEDPIEFVHKHKGCVVNQREIGTDAISFGEALRAALRQDPDVILVGEMRDLETIAIALTAAETGHLVLGTLHTQSAPGTIDRMIDVFPAEQQEQIRIQIAGTLEGVITQALIPTADGQGRIAALEILLPDDAVRNLIRQGKVEQVYSIMQTGTARGMQTMEQALAELIMRRVITQEAGLARTSRPDQLIGLLERGGFTATEPGASAPPLHGGLRVAGS